MNKELTYNNLIKKTGHIIATHDLSLTNFKKCLNKKTISYPSIALHNLKTINEDCASTGFAGNELFGEIRLVIDSKKLVSEDGTRLIDDAYVYDGNIYSAMIPQLQYCINEDDLLDFIAGEIDEHPCVNEIMKELMDTLSDDAFEDKLTCYADFHTEVARTTAIRFLFSKHINDDVYKITNFQALKQKLSDKLYMHKNPLYNDFINTILERLSIQKKMCIDNEYFELNDAESEVKLINDFFECYPLNENGALLRQLRSQEPTNEVSLDKELITALFSKKINNLSELHYNKDRLINTGGIIEYSSDKSRFTSAIHELYLNLLNQPQAIVKDAMEKIFLNSSKNGYTSAYQMADLFSTQGVVMDDELLNLLIKCEDNKSTDLQQFFEMKINQELPLEFVNHIVVPDIIKNEVKSLLKQNAVNISVHSYSGETRSAVLWGRVNATFDCDIKSICLLDRDGSTPVEYSKPHLVYNYSL